MLRQEEEQIFLMENPSFHTKKGHCMEELNELLRRRNTDIIKEDLDTVMNT